jgi:hypothetical protein
MIKKIFELTPFPVERTIHVTPNLYNQKLTTCTCKLTYKGGGEEKPYKKIKDGNQGPVVDVLIIVTNYLHR